MTKEIKMEEFEIDEGILAKIARHFVTGS